MPTQPNEIAIENSQRSNFPRNMAIGDTIVVEQIFYISDFKVEGHSDPRIEAYKREEMGKQDALEKQYERLATYEYPHYLADVAEYEEDAEPFTFESFLPYYKENAQKVWDYLRELEISEVTGERPPMPRYTLQDNVYNTIESEFHNAFQVDRIQSLIYYKQAESGNAAVRNQRNIKVGDEEDQTLSLVELIQKYGFPYTDYVKVTKEYVLTGIFEDYSNIWASGDYYYPTAFVTEAEKNQIVNVLGETSVIDDLGVLKREHTLFGKRILFFNQMLSEEDDIRYVENHLAYPKDASNTDLILTYGILALIFIGTIVSVFQINYAQIRRRTKKIVLLKSIGMVRNQVIQLLLFEVLIILVVALPIGFALGTGISFGLVKGVQHFTGVSLTFEWAFLWVACGVFAVILSVLIGMIIPMRHARRVPLVGAMNVVSFKRINGKRTHREGELKIARMSPMKLILRRLTEEKKKTWMTFSLYMFSALMLLMTVPMALVAFKPYQEQVIVPDLPDYEVTFSMGLDRVSKEQVAEELMGLLLFENVDMVLGGEQLRVYHPNWNAIERYQNKIQTADGMGKLAFLPDVFEPIENVAYRQQTLLTNVYSYEANSKSLEALINRTGESITSESFSQSTNQALLLLPYHDGLDLISYRQQDAWKLTQSYPFKVGDPLKVASINEGNEKESYLKMDLEIAGVIVGLDTVGIWPFTDQTNEPILIVPESVYRTLYPQTRYKFLPPSDMLNEYVEIDEWMKFGKTYLALELKEGNTINDADVAFKTLSRPQISNLNEPQSTRYDYAKINPTHFIKQSTFNKSLRIAFVVSILGLSMTLILWLVQYNIGVSKMESERSYVGVLQAIGITNKSFKRVYLLIGCGFALFALCVANAVIFGGVLAVGVVSSLPMTNFLSQFFWGFPWGIYALLQVIFLVIGTWIYVVPCAKILKNNPVSNISAIQR